MQEVEGPQVPLTPAVKVNNYRTTQVSVAPAEYQVPLYLRKLLIIRVTSLNKHLTVHVFIKATSVRIRSQC